MAHPLTKALRDSRSLSAMLMMLVPLGGQAAQHALLIGVSDYADPRIPDLEGPVHDVQALHDVLVQNWQFDSSRITVLTNEHATEDAILGAIDSLKSSTAKGDDIIIYYSGHGTSAKDPDLGSHLDLPDGSGAIVASDFNPGKLGSRTFVEPASDGLLVGRFEIRPRLEILDADRNVLVIFDACFSGNASRNLASRYRPVTKRQIDLASWKTLAQPASTAQKPAAKAAGKPARTRSLNLDTATSFTYDNTVYFGASAEDQFAVDISSAEIAAGYASTIDGKPHGGFTDSLLRALWQTPGQSPTLSFATLFNRTLNQFNTWCKACGHTPVSLPAANTPNHDLLTRTILSADSEWASYNIDSESSLPILNDLLVIDSQLLDQQDASFEQVLAKRTVALNAATTPGSPDIYFKNINENIQAYTADGALITQFPSSMPAQNLSAWLSGREWLKRRTQRDMARELGELQVSFRHPLAGHQVSEGEFLHFTVHATSPAQLVIFVLDANSELSLLYPINKREQRNLLIPAMPQRIPDQQQAPLQVRPPWGTDTVLFYGLTPGHALNEELDQLARLPSIPFDHASLVAFESALQSAQIPYSAAAIRVVAGPAP